MMARGMVGMTTEGTPWMRSPIRLADDETNLQPAPAYGEHTRQVLLDCGFTGSELEALSAAKVIRQSP